ncbi:NUDIX hydrolase [Martelella mediterranea]|uniref:NUDIX domain-containing protein n=1 Tax=Martelella mediterranea TaxID=293089 RepID=A0A4R3NQW2_9HYPH|nr:NUDIX hydrolase [Martelella mediterranea]TCT37176.1 hypothetical protein EDC90_102068 [Martelella mediterranea]
MELQTSLAGWPPENKAFPVRDIDIRVQPGALEFLGQYEAAIAANWEAEIAANPHLFNGKLLTIYELAFTDGIVRANAKVVPYAYHLWWRRQASPPPTFHAFAMAVLISSDDAVMAIRMSETTANPGKVYCASGSLELSDIVDGRVDVDANMAREVAEETGIDLTALRPGADYYCAHSRQCVMFYRFYRSELPAEKLVEKVHAHMRRDDEKEIDAVIPVTRGNMNSFDYGHSMPPALDLFFRSQS